MMKKLFLFLVALGMSATLCAAEGDETPAGTRGRGGRDGRPGMRRRGEFGQGMARVSPLARFKAEKEMSRKFPKEFAEAEKQLLEAEKKIQELAKKAKVDLPVSFESKMRELKSKQPAAFDKLLEEQDFRKAARDMRELAKANGIDLGMQGGRPRGMMGPGMRERGGDAAPQAPMRRRGPSISRLRRLYPAEMAKLEELRKTDPAAYRAGIAKLNEQMEKSAEAPKK